MKRLKTEHRSGDPFHSAMVLLDDIVEVDEDLSWAGINLLEIASSAFYDHHTIPSQAAQHCQPPSRSRSPMLHQNRAHALPRDHPDSGGINASFNTC